ncbi:hypothetical protein F2Q70_00013714 [Brassica cretica]|uniref:Uncharacterized protein n=1 Tax=Brassica cretica TaxID=69181 RepID=A0A8S9LRZ0_BRACR|nr:hypothetical protein F2Q70_00013714 [Brassica cretica]
MEWIMGTYSIFGQIVNLDMTYLGRRHCDTDMSIFFLGCFCPSFWFFVAIVTMAKEHTAAAATVNTRSLMIFMLCSCFLFVEALTTLSVRLLVPEMVTGSFETTERNEDV